MTLIIGTNQNSTTSLYILTAVDNFILPANVVSQTTSGYGVISSNGGHHFIIEGTLIASVVGVLMGNESQDFGNILTIAATGVVASTGLYGVQNLGGQATILSQGLVTGYWGLSFFSNMGTGSFATNAGRIITEDYSVYHVGTEKLTFNNTGTVTSFDNNSFQSDSITAVDVIINKGTMTGNVVLGGGADTYEGNGGLVVGKVFGESGIDTLRGGALTDRLNGGTGTDYLTGRGGKDILTGGGPETDHFFYYATSELGDTILDFTTADFLRFKSTAFGNATIAGDHLCTIANFRSNLSGLAEDATDRFIYETDRDILWFDANGTAAGGRFLVTDFNYDVNLTRGDIFIF